MSLKANKDLMLRISMVWGSLETPVSVCLCTYVGQEYSRCEVKKETEQIYNEVV